MHALDWIRESRRESLRPVYAIVGTDAYLIRESSRGVSRAVFPELDDEAAISRFPGPQTELSTVLDELFTLPFFSRRRLVIVEDADTFVTKHRKDLESYVQKPSASGILVLQVKQWTFDHGPGQTRGESGTGDRLHRLRDKDTAKIVAWLIQYAQTRCDARLEKGAANLLVELAGLEVGILTSEVEKLAVYAGSSKKIERGDVAKMVGAGRVETIWKALDAATTGQGGPHWSSSTTSWRGARYRGDARSHERVVAQSSSRRPAPCRAIEPGRGLPDRGHAPLRHREDRQTAQASGPSSGRSASGNPPASRPGPQGWHLTRPARRPGTPAGRPVTTADRLMAPILRSIVLARLRSFYVTQGPFDPVPNAGEASDRSRLFLPKSGSSRLHFIGERVASMRVSPD